MSASTQSSAAMDFKGVTSYHLDDLSTIVNRYLKPSADAGIQGGKNFCPNYVQEFDLSYFTSPFAIARGLEMRLSVSPVTPFSDASLPNHTKMFELVHMVTSMNDFD